MPKSILHLIAFICATFYLSSCGNTNQNSTNNILLPQNNSVIPQKEDELSIDFLGNYHGIQPSYFVKNQYGDDLVINGNKIPVPSIDYKFLLKEKNMVSLQQINLEDNSRVYYDGIYKIISNDSDANKIECSLSDGHSSTPTYVLTINKNDKKGFCTSNNEPEFSIKKIKN
jgi:hypothetical protein